MNQEIGVSVLCTAYNHEKYIRQCLDGFIMQKADFAFEVLVNDDCSTDRTADIIREYAEKYPEIIRPFYQKKNLYSQKISISATVFAPEIRGKYIALCEGDDYWTDPMKLQKQFDVMEDNPDCHFSVHSVYRLVGDDITSSFPNGISTGFLSTKQVLQKNAEAYSFHTSSFLFRTDDYFTYLKENPAFKRVCDVGDEPMVLYFCQLGLTSYFQESMSAYRIVSENSWNQRVRSSKLRTSHFAGMAHMMEEYDLYTNYQYHDICLKYIFRMHYINATYFDWRYKELLAPELKDAFREANLACKIKANLDRWFPHLFSLLYTKYRTIKK